MSDLESKSEALQQDRRQAARFAIKCSACFRSVSGERRGVVENVSELGARFTAPSLPAKGVTGLLIFGGNEVFCKVAWTSTEACGVVFDHPISLEDVAALAGKEMRVQGPVASAGNIPMGRKRSGRLVSGDD
ncbi:PilZ domain-containing protein [Altererythrobacter arenosus]|uniref:PilZ domain-containing protein n=1 Tax=Altererythrobacter arenosus TaxID=3032592 RepID=A0ABY8FRF7_9SPHN|nr:PilZ domain-containing protein [Altererythrobacter sp. CAU 1644]WFL76488.1 PilZ domain-containing protein [Altererythrobacter sp. CAU 1644]